MPTHPHATHALPFPCLSYAHAIAVVRDDAILGGTMRRLMHAYVDHTMPCDSYILVSLAPHTHALPFVYTCLVYGYTPHICIGQQEQDAFALTEAARMGATLHATPHSYTPHIYSYARSLAATLRATLLPLSLVCQATVMAALGAAQSVQGQAGTHDELWIYNASPAMIIGIAASTLARTIHAVSERRGPLPPGVRFVAMPTPAMRPPAPPFPCHMQTDLYAYDYARRRADATRRVIFWNGTAALA